MYPCFCCHFCTQNLRFCVQKCPRRGFSKSSRRAKIKYRLLLTRRLCLVTFAHFCTQNRRFCEQKWAKVCALALLAFALGLAFAAQKQPKVRSNFRFAVTFAHKIFDFVSKSVPFGGSAKASAWFCYAEPIVGTEPLLRRKSDGYPCALLLRKIAGTEFR